MEMKTEEKRVREKGKFIIRGRGFENEHLNVLNLIHLILENLETFTD